MWDENTEILQGKLSRKYNRIPKYVASRMMTEVGWQNSHLLDPDVPAAVEKLRAEPGGEIRWGSTELIKTLARHDLVDEYRLAVYPLVLVTARSCSRTSSRMLVKIVLIIGVPFVLGIFIGNRWPERTVRVQPCVQPWVRRVSLVALVAFIVIALATVWARHTVRKKTAVPA